MKTLMFCL